MRRSFFLSLVLVLGLGVFLAGCAGSDKDKADPDDPNRSALYNRFNNNNNNENNNECTGPLCDEPEAPPLPSARCAGSDCGVPPVCSGDECNNGPINRSEPEAPPEVEILEPGMETEVVELPSALYGESYPEYVMKAGSGSGSYTWEFVNPNADELAGIDSSGNSVYGRPPIGMQLVPQAVNEEKEQEAKIGSRSITDELGTYVFKVKVIDNINPTRSDERVFKILLADKIVIDVYKGNKGEWKRVSGVTSTENCSGDVGCYNVTSVAAPISVDAGQTLKLVARGHGNVSNYRWCLWGGASTVCGIENDLDNGYFKLKTEKSGQRSEPNRTDQSVRYLSVGRNFAAPAEGNNTHPITVDDLSGNGSNLYFRNVDFECHGQLRTMPGSAEQVITIMGNMATGDERAVHTTLGAFDGSEGKGYKWFENTLLRYYVREEYESLLTIALSKSFDSQTSVDVSFKFKAPAYLTLKQYRDMLDEEYLASTTISVRDTICGGSGSYTIRYKLSDLERDEYGAKIGDGNHLYLDPASSMNIEVIFNDIDETAGDSKMIVRLRQKERAGGTPADYCVGNDTWWKERRDFEIGLHHCPSAEDGVGLDCSENTISSHGTSRIDKIDTVCLKFINGGGGGRDWMGIWLNRLKLLTPHWETIYREGDDFHPGCGEDTSNVVCGATRTINITDDFYVPDSYFDHSFNFSRSPELINNWILRSESAE